MHDWPKKLAAEDRPAYGRGAMEQVIYKICPQSEWLDASQQGSYAGSADDRRDGFIHFSTYTQLAGTLAKHFAGQEDLLLIMVRADRLGDELKWEPSRGGQLFPHLYASLSTDAALDARLLKLMNRTHIIPDECAMLAEAGLGRSGEK